jgi:hypothetical protein
MIYEKPYIIPGDVFADETVLCLRCGTQIMGLSYKEMPKVNSPQEMVKVAHKKKFGNYRLLPVVLYRLGKESILHIVCCQDCLKEIDPARDSEVIIKQIVTAFQIEAKYAGAPQEMIDGISRKYADARTLRKLTTEELLENRIMETV